MRKWKHKYRRKREREKASEYGIKWEKYRSTKCNNLPIKWKNERERPGKKKRNEEVPVEGEGEKKHRINRQRESSRKETEFEKNRENDLDDIRWFQVNRRHGWEEREKGRRSKEASQIRETIMASKYLRLSWCWWFCGSNVDSWLNHSSLNLPHEECVKGIVIVIGK